MRQLQPLLHAAVALALLASTCSCERAWNAANRHGLTADVESLLEQSGIPELSPVSCTMVGSTRAGACEVTLGPDAVDLLVERLRLDELDTSDPGDLTRLDSLTSVPGSCQQPDHDGTRFLVVTGRPAELRLTNGSAFEYLLLVYTPSSPKACLQVAYAYG